MFFKYKVDYLNDATDTEDVALGFVYGDDYGDAASKVLQAYFDSIIDMTLYAMDSVTESVLEYDGDLHSDKAIFAVTMKETSPIKREG